MRIAILASSLGCAALLYACTGDDPVLGGPDNDAGVGDGPASDVTLGDGASDAGCAADLSTSTAHCGRCDHSCLGGKCVAGSCQPVTLYAEAAGEVSALAIAGDDVYWASLVAGQHGELRTCHLPDCAGSVRTLASSGTDGGFTPNPELILGLAADETNVYFTAYYQPYVYRCPRAGCVNGQPQVFASTLGSPRDIQLDAANVYWMSESEGVRACPKIGCTAERGLMSTGAIFGDRITLDGDYAYFTSQRSDTPPVWNPGVYRVSKDAVDASAEAFAIELEQPKVVAIAGSTAFFTEWGPDDGGLTAGHIRRSQLGSLVTDVADGLAHPFFVLLDGDTLYVTAQADGTLRRCTTSSCASSTIIASDQLGIHVLRQDAVSLYWNDRPAARVMRLAK